MQLTLDIVLPDDETFDSFQVGENAQLVQALQSAVASPAGKLWYIYAEQGTGCSHLLHAVCDLAGQKQLPAALIPLANHNDLVPQMLDGLEMMSLICIDDVQDICAKPDWEFALFDLINRVRETGQSDIVIAANAPLNALPVKLPDLASRLSWGTSYRINPLSEVDKQQVLINRAEMRGIHLPEEVGQFLISRQERDIKSLINTLDKLDKASMSQHRKLTIPFVKQVLGL